MDTRQRGDTAEAAVLYALVREGMTVWTPWSPFGPSDLLAETPAGRIFRLQVKSARLRAGCLLANARSTDHGRGPQSYLGSVDAIVLHAPDIEDQFVVPIEVAQECEIRLRVHPARNHQRLRVRRAEDYRLADWVARVCNGHTIPASVSATRA